jgi:hypothetical protein
MPRPEWIQPSPIETADTEPTQNVALAKQALRSFKELWLTDSGREITANPVSVDGLAFTESLNQLGVKGFVLAGTEDRIRQLRIYSHLTDPNFFHANPGEMEALIHDPISESMWVLRINEDGNPVHLSQHYLVGNIPVLHASLGYSIEYGKMVGEIRADFPDVSVLLFGVRAIEEHPDEYLPRYIHYFVPTQAAEPVTPPAVA